MKTTTQRFYRPLLILLMAMIAYHSSRGQTLAKPTIFTALGSGTQSVTGASISGPESWFRWTCGDGVTRLDAKIIQQGTAYQNSSAELYLSVSTDSIHKILVDSLNSDSALYLAAGYLTSTDTIFIRFVNVNGVCGTCTYSNPIVDFTIFSTTSGCSPSPCSLVRNGSFEQANSGPCGGYDITDGVDCWYPYENSTDVFRRNCTANGGANNLGTNTYNYVPVINSHNGPPNNTIIGELCHTQGSTGYYIENIQNPLVSPLLPGHTYELSFWAYNNHSGVSNPMGYPCWVTFATSPGYAVSPSTNLAMAGSFPSGLNILNNFVVIPVNTWTAYTYTFTFAGGIAGNLLVGPNFQRNSFDGYVNTTDNKVLYILLDDIEIREITNLTVSSSATVCAGQTATLTASGMTSYLWQPGNVSGATINANPIATTVYTVTGTDAVGCTKTKTVTVTVLPLPTITMLTPTIGICPGGSAGLSAVGGVSYTWSPCSVGCNSNALVVNPSVATTYTVTGLASGCTNTATAYVYILDPTNSIQVSGYTTICQGESAYLSATGATNYTWSPCTSGCNNATLAPTPSVTTTYTVRGINACGVLSTSTVVVTVKPTWPVNPAVLSNPVCAGYTVSLIANGGSPYSYTWTPGNVVGTMITVTPSVTTSYTACTAVPGCSTTCAAVTVSVFPVPSLTITPASFTVCAGTPTTISVSGASTYTWSTGETTTSIAVTPTTSTTYTVAGSVYSCPTLTASSTAYLYPAITVTTAPHVTSCPGANTSITAAGGTGNYTWTPGGATGPSVIVSPTVPTVYTVSSTAPGCTLTATALVNPVICCAVNTAITFTATSGSLNGGTFNLNGPLTLSADLTLDDITIFMGTNAEIIVPNNIKFTLNQCHFLGCPQMWKGIRFIGPNGSMHVTKNSLIEDAITAVDVSNVTAPYNSANIFFVETSTFNKNHTAISAANYTTNSNNYPMHLADNIFTSRKLFTPDHQLMNPALTLTYNWPTDNTSTLKGFAGIPNTFTPDVNLQTGYEFSIATYSTSNMEIPNSGSVGHQGIRLKDIYSTNSSYNGFRMTAFEGTPYVYDNFNYYNVFDNMHYGINAENSNIMVAHAAFQNMSQYVTGTSGGFKPIKYYDGGVGINSISTMANGLGSSQTFSLAAGPIINGFNKSTNFFFNNAYGIKTENIQYLNIGFNVFHSNRTYTSGALNQFNAPVGKGEYGVYVKSVDYRGINIKRNFTANINNGIVFIANGAPFVGSIQLQYAGTVSIQNNTLKANYGSSITASQSMKQGIATDNLLSPNGLQFANGTPVPVTVSGNTIDKAFIGITAFNWNKQRIFDNSNTIILVNDGFANSNQYGIEHFNNMGDNLVSNNIKGFNMTKKKVYGILAAENKGQSFWCNFTENSYIGTLFVGSQNLTSWKQNTMTKHQQAMRLDNTTIGTQGASGQPINNTWSGSWTGAYKLFVNGIDPGTPSGNSKLYMSALPSTAESDGTPITFRYKTTIPQSLFLTTGASGVSCPYVPSGLEPVMFTGYQENLDHIVTDAYEYTTYLTGNRKNGKLAVYRALLEDSTLLATDTILQNFKAASDAGNIGKFFAVEQYLSEADYGNAEATLSAISPADSVEIGLKKLYKIYLHSKSDNYDATDESDLIALANSCPAQMGIGVYQARVLLNSIYDVYCHYESDCGDTNNVAYRKIRSNDEFTDLPAGNNFMVYPNPSSGVIYFTASNMGIETYQVTVYDITGKAIFMKEYTDGEKVNSIDLDLSNGVYLMQLTDQSNGEVHKQKFVIQK